MNAHKFVAEHGIDKAKRVLRSAYTHCVYVETPTHFDIEESVLVHENDFKEICESHVDLKELKQVVESVNKINDFGGIGLANLIDQSTYGENLDLVRAIADYKLVESYKSSNGQTINHYCVSDFKENETLGHLYIKQNSQVEVLDMVDVSPNCEVRNG